MPVTDAGPAADTGAPGDAALRDLAAALGRALLAEGMRLAVAESCTGGWIAKVLTDIPGASDWFDAGFVTYSNDAKLRMLGVSPATLEAQGAVSEAVVREMATGARRAAGTAAAVAVSGVAGPGGGSADKPVGLVWFGFSLGDRDWACRAMLAGDREAVRRQSVGIALGALLEALAH
jgi:nicotinamide-nucleotide amidase